MAKMPVKPICDLGMVKADYRYVIPNGKLPFHGYRIAISQGGEAKGQFDVPQGMAEQFANELIALASLIRAHSPHREAD
jgi:hypothetical protein